VSPKAKGFKNKSITRYLIFSIFLNFLMLSGCGNQVRQFWL